MHHSLSTPPTESQARRLSAAKAALNLYTQALDALFPDGPEKKNVLHRLVALSMVIDYGIIHTDTD